MGVRAYEGDWFIGTQSAVRGSKLIYAMQVSSVLDFDKYYRDARFQAKKPVVNGTPCQRCGDNMYFGDKGQWIKLPSVYHRQKIQIDQDLRYPRVFVSERFYYFGGAAIEVPREYRELIWKRHGCKWHDSNDVIDFLDWLQYDRTPGIHGEPSDMPKRAQVGLVSANGVGNCSCSDGQ